MYHLHLTSKHLHYAIFKKEPLQLISYLAASVAKFTKFRLHKHIQFYFILFFVWIRTAFVPPPLHSLRGQPSTVPPSVGLRSGSIHISDENTRRHTHTHENEAAGKQNRRQTGRSVRRKPHKLLLAHVVKGAPCCAKPPTSGCPSLFKQDITAPTFLLK